MTNKVNQKPSIAIGMLREHLYHHGYRMEQKKWQSVTAPAPTWETIKVNLSFPMPQTIQEMKSEIRPNLPWADDHFQERIGGKPLNPGEQYKNWPFYKRKPEDDKFRTWDKQFSHTYMERFWPKYAGFKDGVSERYPEIIREGIRFNYGDLHDVITLLNSDPTTRQAYLPIWFPEDTGCNHNQRVPCTLGYDFIIRNNFLHMDYYMRSCDYLRHLRDDVYMAIRLAHYIMDQLKASRLDKFEDLQLGLFDMHIKNLHVFENERGLLKLDK